MLKGLDVSFTRQYTDTEKAATVVRTCMMSND